MLDEILARGNLRMAFERVRENHGCRGADGMSVGHFAADLEREIDRLQDRLLRRCYQPTLTTSSSSAAIRIAPRAPWRSPTLFSTASGSA